MSPIWIISLQRMIKSFLVQKYNQIILSKKWSILASSATVVFWCNYIDIYLRFVLHTIIFEVLVLYATKQQCCRGRQYIFFFAKCNRIHFCINDFSYWFPLNEMHRFDRSGYGNLLQLFSWTTIHTSSATTITSTIHSILNCPCPTCIQ